MFRVLMTPRLEVEDILLVLRSGEGGVKLRGERQKMLCLKRLDRMVGEVRELWNRIRAKHVRLGVPTVRFDVEALVVDER